MKKLFLSSLSCLLLLSICISCKPDDSGDSGLPDTQAPENTVDQLSQKVNHKMIVMNGNTSEVGKCLLSRISVTTDTALALGVFIPNSKIASLTEAEKSSIRHIFSKGGSIVIDLPEWNTYQTFRQMLGLEPHDFENPDIDNHFLDIIAFNNHGDEFRLLDIHEDDALPVLSDSITYEVDTTSGLQTLIGRDSTQNHQVPDRGELTQYSYGKHADGVAKWINTYSKENHYLSASKLRTSSQLEELTGGQTVTLQYNYHSIHEKGKDKNALFTVTYTIYSLYSFDQDCDYYLIQQEMGGNSDAVKIPNWKEDGYNCYGFYLGNIECNHQITDTEGHTVYLSQSSPATTVTSETIGTSIGFNLGGSIGLGMTGPSANVTGGISFSSSISHSYNSLSVTNNSGTQNSTDANWKYSVNFQEAGSNGWTSHINDAPEVALHYIAVHNAWIWRVVNPGDHSFCMYARNYVGYSYTYHKDKFFTYTYGRKTSGLIYPQYIELEKPNRQTN